MRIFRSCFVILVGISLCQAASNCSGLPCSYHCQLVGGAARCYCPEGYRLQGHTSCLAEGPSPLLLFTVGNEVKSVDPVTHSITQLHEEQDPVVNVVFDSLDSILYWSVPHLPAIRSLQHGNLVQDVIAHGLKTPEGMTVDWIGRHLYFTDYGLQHVVACNLDGSMCSVIISTDIEHPKSVAVDPRRGVLYWSDWSPEKPKIELAGMDGQNRSAILTSDLKWPHSLTIDYLGERLCWTDVRYHSIECSNYDGTQRKMLFEGHLHHPYGLAVFEESVFWSDLHFNAIYTMRKDDRRGASEDPQRALQLDQRPMGIQMFHPALQPQGPNMCAFSRCSHLCLLNMKGGSTCQCPRGLELQTDGHTCIAKPQTSYLLIARKTHLLKVFPEFIGKNPQEVIQVPHMKNVVALDYDWSTRSVIYSDVEKKTIERVILNEANSRSVLENNSLSLVEDLAVDWLAKNIFFIDSHVGKSVIEVMRLDGTSRITLIEENIEKAKGIAVHPTAGLLFYSNWGHHARVDRCNMDGTNCRILAGQLGLPNGLTIDTNSQLLFWVDSMTDSIESINVDGSNRKTVFRNMLHPFSIAVHDNRLFWTDWRSPSLHYIEKQDGRPLSGSAAMEVSFNGEPLMGMVVISASKQKGGNSCSENGVNGGCSHLCLAKPVHHVCRCPVGMQLASDQSTCQNIPDSQGGSTSLIQFQCADKSYIDILFYCDGSPDCADGSDEVDCEVTCMAEEFQCNDQQCITNSWRCDGDTDCEDGSDEAHCSKLTCAPSDFSCGSRCIKSSFICDGFPDCSDESDEADCSNVTCLTGEFRCNGGRCIPSGWRCDGSVDCEAGNDEENCESTEVEKCQPGHWRCNDGTCISLMWLCDGERDCPDDSDELNCTETSTITMTPATPSEHEATTTATTGGHNQTPVLPANCSPHNSLMCPSTGVCLPLSWRCDGHKDCPMGEDEEDCGQSCEIGQFMCKNSHCIPERWTCDRETDCTDGSDETRDMCDYLRVRPTPPVHPGIVDCPSVGMFTCESGECLDYSSVCDRHTDCIDGSDEGMQCDVACQHPNGHCSHICHKTPQGSFCSCPAGLETMPADPKVCQDVNECALSEYLCSHYCVNTKASYRCDCAPGYQLEGDLKTCKAEVGVGKLLFTQEFEVRYLSLDGHQYGTFSVKETERDAYTIAVDFDHVTDEVYWTTAKGKVFHSKRGKVAPQSCDKYDHKLAEGIAVDWLGRNLYTTDFLRAKIEVCPLESCGTCADLVDTLLHKPRAIALHPGKGLMFWLDWGDVPKLERAWMDGQHREVLVSQKLIWPNGLTIDYILDRLYWVDARRDVIESVDLNGNDRKLVTSEGIHHPFGMTLFEDNLFWSDWITGAIYAINKFTGQNRKIVHDGLMMPKGVAIMHPLRQPKSENHPCQQLKGTGCNQMCIGTPVGAVCICGKGFHKLGEHKCQSDEEKINTPPSGISLKCSGYCENGGTCRYREHHPYCICPDGVQGKRCENKENADSDPTETLGPFQHKGPSKGLVAAVAVVCIILMLGVGLVCFIRRRSQRIMRESKRAAKEKMSSTCRAAAFHKGVDLNESQMYLTENAQYDNPGFEPDEEDTDGTFYYACPPRPPRFGIASWNQRVQPARLSRIASTLSSTSEEPTALVSEISFPVAFSHVNYHRRGPYSDN